MREKYGKDSKRVADFEERATFGAPGTDTLDRRGFLKGALAAAGGAALLTALPGCAPATGETAATTPSGSGDATNAAGGPPAGYQCASDWLGTAPVIAEADISETISTEVLVLGGGHAGIHVALAAAEGGAQVAVIEMTSESNRKVKGEDIGHVNSQWLINQGFGPYNVGEIVNEFCIRTNGRVNPEIIRKYVANSGEAFDHVVSLVKWPDSRIKVSETADPAISPLDPSQIVVQVPGIAADGSVEYPIKRGGYKTWAACAQFMGPIQHEPQEGVAAFSRLDEFEQFAILEGLDKGVQWYYEQSAVVLVQDASGAVTGAITKTQDGVYTKYEASKAVVLTTGDFAANGDMIWALNTEISEWAERAGGTPDDVRGFSTSDGTGHKLGCWAGGQIEPSPRAVMSMGGGGGGPWGTAAYLWINSEGRRFMNEAATLLAWPVSLRQPAGAIASVTDKKWYETLKQASLDHGAPNYGRPVYYEELVEDMDNVPVGNPEGGTCRTCTIAERMPSTVYAANTLDELADFLGYAGEAKNNFLTSIEDYNRLCYAGADTQFGKDSAVMIPVDEPPFYGASAGQGPGPGVSAGLVTLAGLVTNNDLQVVDTKGEVIKGLWAAGNCLGGRYGGGYATPFAGNSIGMAITHGRVVGKLITGQEVL